MQIPEQTINDIRERADIVEVAGRFVDLHRAGTNFKAICPFHEEKTPSFVVSPDKQIFHCFGCGKGGNVFTFVMEMEGVSFPEAVESLGKQYGIEIRRQTGPDPERSQNEGLYRVNDFAARWFHRNLEDDVIGRPAREYLKARGIPEALWTSFQLGYASDAWEAFYSATRRKRVPLADLRTLKLIVSREKRDGFYDYFRKRLMFPILSASGRVIGFGGRGLDPSVVPKYLNSIESPIYHKRQALYGMPQAREAIRQERRALLVEGYMDCLALHGHGFAHVVASCGTSLTSDHAGLLRRLTRHVVLVPDADAAGLEAALAAGAHLLAAGLDVSVVLLESGEDPDSAVRKLGRAEFAKKLAGALDYLQYVDYIMKDHPMTPREKAAVIQRVRDGLAPVTDALRYEVLLQDLGRAFGVGADALRRRRAAAPAGSEAPKRGKVVSAAERERRSQLEKMLLRLLLEATPETAAERERLDVDDFSVEKYRQFYKLLDSAWESHIDITSKVFQQQAEKVGLEGLAAEISLIPIPPGNSSILLRDTVRRVKELQIREELVVLREKLRELPEESEDAVAVAEHYARLKKELSEL